MVKGILPHINTSLDDQDNSCSVQLIVKLPASSVLEAIQSHAVIFQLWDSTRNNSSMSEWFYLLTFIIAHKGEKVSGKKKHQQKTYSSLKRTACQDLSSSTLSLKWWFFFGSRKTLSSSNNSPGWISQRAKVNTPCKSHFFFQQRLPSTPLFRQRGRNSFRASKATSWKGKRRVSTQRKPEPPPKKKNRTWGFSSENLWKKGGVLGHLGTF